MPYPENPFAQGNDVYAALETAIISNNLRSKHEAGDNVARENTPYLPELLAWICKPPEISSYRVNTLRTTVDTALETLKLQILKISQSRKINDPPRIYTHTSLQDIIVIERWPVECLDLHRKSKEVIVDTACGAAILRGAHIFAPGVLGMESGIQQDDPVSIFTDITGQCKRGLLKRYEEDSKVFIGNGIVRMTRKQLFKDGVKPEGIAVEVTDPSSGCLNIDLHHIPPCYILLHNLPSVVCGYVLNPKSGEHILDMCAAPGNKTTHICALLNNEGVVIALEKVKTKIGKLKERCAQFNAQNVHVFQFDSTKALDQDLHDRDITTGPPFPGSSFDKILLDAPCSGLGQRPQLLTKISAKMLQSYVPLQRKLFHTAVQLLKPGGFLIYSTCTITIPENEGLVVWALKTFPDIQLVPAEPKVGGNGWEIVGLSTEQCVKLQRFGPPNEPDSSYCDSVGFFIAKFQKREN